MPYGIQDFKLAVLSDEFTDEEIEQILHETEVKTENEIREVVSILREHCPELYEKIESDFPLFARRL